LQNRFHSAKITGISDLKSPGLLLCSPPIPRKAGYAAAVKTFAGLPPYAVTS